MPLKNVANDSSIATSSDATLLHTPNASKANQKV